MIDGNKKRLFYDLDHDSFMQLMLKDYSLRQFCYCCDCKGNYSGADIALGDFWGVEKVAPDILDDKGVSLILLHNEKAKDVFNKIEQSLRYREVDFQTAIKYNRAYSEPVKRPMERDFLFCDLCNLPWKTIEKNIAARRCLTA